MPHSLPQPAVPRAQRKVVVVAYERLRTFEFGITVELFGLRRPEFDFTWYGFEVCAAEQRRMAAAGGIEVVADGGLERLDNAGTVIVPGWRDVREAPPAALCDALARAHADGARMVSLCTGAFVLAAAGILDGRSATTHWLHTAELARRFPKVHVHPNRLYTEDGPVFTSAGSAAAIDLCLHLIRKDFGSDTAFRVSQRLVAPPHRSGGQAQYTPMPEAESDESSLAKVMVWLTQDLRRPVAIGDIAAQAHMSKRTLHRRFTEATGKGPLAWLMDQRLRSARQMLRHTDLSIDDVALACGFVSVETFRQQFKKRVGVSPSSYRETFDAH